MRAIRGLFDSTHKIAVLAVIVILLIIVAVSASVAWLADRPLTPTGGEVIPGYFAGGDGTAEHPYIINRPIHLYNLAWLQDTGRFNQPDENGDYTQFHFVLSADLDMTGIILPPIGTREYPFIGTFESETSTTDGTVDEVKYTISNLTVSNALGLGEVEKRPQSVTELLRAEIVGMFGVIGVYDLGQEATVYGSIVPSVSDFYLENPTVRAQSDATLIGLIAGYVNGKVHNVGVIGGRLESGSVNNAAFLPPSISYYALIGNKSESVNWGGITAPGAGSGAIKVDANDSDLYDALEDDNGIFSTGHYLPVPESAKDRAFVTGSNVSVGTVSGGIKEYYFYKNLVSGNGSTYTPTQSTSTSFTPGALQQGFITGSVNSSFEENSDFYTRINNSGGPGSTTIATGTAAPIFSGSGMTPVTFSDGVTRNLPSNGIWFQPAASGMGIISFVISNKGEDYRYKSIYKYQRDTDGNIINLVETKLTFAKQNFNNKTVIFFEYEITDADIDGGFEFFIGSSTDETDDNIQFYFLALAGSGTKGAVITPDSKELLQVNFIDAETMNNGGDVAANGMTVTTFDIKLTTTNNALEYVTFQRSNMQTDATCTLSGLIAADKYSHSAIVLPQESG